MPMSAKRARKLIERGDATPFWKHGIFCVRLNREPSARNMQPVAVGVDPGSKREGFSVRSAARDYIHVDADAKTWVGKKLEARRVLRRARRRRKTPCRSPKTDNRDDVRRKPPAGTRARWEWKLDVLRKLSEIYPVTDVVVEDVKADNRDRGRKWNGRFSPLECGKRWFYNEVETRWGLHVRQGHETAAERDRLGLRKTRSKLGDRWDAHCIDAWVLAGFVFGGDRPPEHRDLLRITPIERQRRCLHRANAGKGGVRCPYGGTNKGGFKVGTRVRHPKHGDYCYTGGAAGGRISLHQLETGKRITKYAKVGDCRRLSVASWRPRFLPARKGGVPTADGI